MNDLIGTIVVIKRNGADGPQFPLRTNKCLFGRKPECDIRIQLPNVSLEHAVVKVDNDRKIKLINLSSCNQTLVNGKPISQVEVQHLDVFTISDRSFRFEFPSRVQKQAKENSPKTQRLRSSSTGNTPQENKTPRMPTPKGSPRTPPTGGSLKENIYRLHRHSMPLQEEEEVLASPGIDKKPFSMIAVNCEPQEKNDESAKLVSEKRKSAGGESKTKRNSKRVSFGPVLSPEQFDKELPPDTPVRRGATPRRASKAGDHSFIQLCSSSKKRRSVIASPQTESITEEDDSQDSSENKTPKTQARFSSKLELTEQGQVTHEVDIHELTSQQCGMPKGRGQPSPQLDTMILGCTEEEGVIPKSPTPEKYTTSSKRMEREITESVAMEAVLKDTPESRRQFPATQATPKSVTPKHSRRSSCRIAEKNCVSAKKDRVSQDYAQSSSFLEEDAVVGDAGPTQAAPETYTPQTSRRSSMRLAGNSPSLLEVRSVDEVQSKVTPHPKTVSLSHSVEENIDETILDSDDYTSDEEDGEREMAIGNNKPTRLATPLRKEIEEGVKLHKTKKKMVTPLKKEIIKGKQLKPTKKSLPTPLKKAISSAVTLRQTKRRLPTPLKEEIKRGVQLQKAKKSLPTPLKEEIKRGVQLQKANKSLPTPLRRQLEQGVSLKQTGKSLKRKRSESSAKDNEPKRLKPSSSQQCGTPKGRGQSLSQLDTMILECTKEEGVIPKSPTPEKFTTSSERVERKITESVAMEAVLKDTPESRKQFRATQATPKSVTPKNTRRSSSRMAEKNCVSAKKDSVSQDHGQSSSSLEEENVGDAGPNQTVLKTYTPQTSRRSSVRLAGNSPSLREVRSVDEKQSKVTPHSKSASLSHSVEENMDETILDSDDCTSDEEDGDREMAIGTDKPTRLATPLGKEIEEGVKLQKTKKEMVTPLKKEIIKGKQLKPTKKSLPTPLKKAISSAVTLRQTKRRLPTPLKEEIKRGVQLQKAKKSLPTPLKEEIKRGVQLQNAKKSLPTPLRRQLEQGVSLKQTGKSSKRKRTESSAKDNEPSIEVNEIDEELDVAPARRALKTPLRKAISAGIRLRKTRHRMATPLRKQIHSRQTLRAVRRKSTVITARKPTYAEIVKRPRKTVTEARRVSRGSCKFRNMAKGSSKATLSAKITDTDVQSLEIEKVQVNDVQLKGRRNNTSLARKSTPQTKSTKLTDSQGTPSFRKRNCWMSSLARATNGVKTRAMPIENLEGLSEMFTTPPAVQMTNNNVSGEKQSGNWLSSLAKATFGSRKRGMPVEDLQGVPEMFATPPSANTGSDCNRRSSMKSLPSTDEEAMVQIMNVAPFDTLQVRADAVSPDKPMLLTESLEPTKTPSLRSSGVDTTQIEIVSPVNSFRTPSLRSGRKHTVKSAVTPRAIIEIGEVLKPNKTPSLRNSAEDAVTIQVVTPVQPSRTPSLRSATTRPCTQNSERPGLELEIVQAIAPSRTPSMRSAAETKAVLRKSIGNSTKDPKTVDLQEPTPRLMKSPKPQPKRYSRKSEGLQGVARLLRTPDAESDLTGDSPKLDGIKAMMQLEKSLASPHLAGLKTLMKTPKISERHMDPEGSFTAELFASPVQDLSQDTTQSVAHEKRSESVMEQTSSKAEATRLMKSPKQSNSIESVENFFVPNMFASPKPQPKRYSRKSEGLQGVARLLRTPDAENDFTGDSPKLDGIKSMMQLEKSLASPHFVGLKTLMKTPKISERHMDPEGYFSAELFASPVQEFSQDTTQSVAHEKRSESVIEPTSSKADATTTARSGNSVSETPPRTTRSRRKAPEDSVEPVPKRVRRTRAAVKQQNEGKTETRSNSKAAQKKTAVKSQKKTAAVIQDTPKPFVFKRTKLDPIIEVQSPLPTLDDAIEITTSSSLNEEAEKASNEERKTGNAPKTRKQSNAPLRSSRRGNRCKAPAETPVEEFTREKVAEQHLLTRRKKTETVAEDSTNTGDSQKAPVKTQEPKGERKRATRNNKANENSLDTMATKTRMTRNQRAEIADLEEEEVNCSFIDEAVINPAPRRARSVAKKAKKNVQVLGKSKPTRSTDREETHDEAADYVPEFRSTRASRKQANESKVVENDNLARNTRGKNKGNEEVKELKKEATTNAIKQPRGTGSARRTRGNSAQKADIEGHDGSLAEEKEVRPDKSSNKPRAKLELKQSTTNASRETRSTRSRKLAEDKVDFTEQSVHSKVGTKRSRQENAGTPPPEPKRTRASVRAQSGPNTRITRSTSRK